MEVSRFSYVTSKAGRDKDKVYVIKDYDDEYVYLIDGRLRQLDNPKKKKRIHIQPTRTVAHNIINKLRTNEEITDRDVEAAMKGFRRK